MDLGYRVVRAAVRAEPVRARLEVRLEDGFEHELEAAWTTRSVTVGTVTSYCPSCSHVLGGFGFLRSALATGPR